jgi:cytochrome c oxidase cbb3-type subunit I/II
MINPRITPGSIMPPYEFMSRAPVDLSAIADKLRAMRAVGVPYTPEQIASADADAHLQLTEVKTLLASEGVKVEGEPELLALISFLRRLGVDTNSPPPAETPVSMKE